ncbi:cell division ATP-binding protein FtsE [Candidatus Berkelbacteria bacterium]|nr:cell division ATP-binding protein FtsE [Candidatus Berkelbacteria bacterium]
MIDLVHVTKSYARVSHPGQRVLALDDVSLTIEKGELVSLVGPSGAGKSTLVRLLIAEERPDSGKLLVAERDISRLAPRELPYYRRKVGVVFQDFKLLPRKTVAENIAFALEVSDASPADIRERVPRMLTLVGLADKGANYPNELSGGEKQRLAIARAMVHSPRILIADEPTGNLDPGTTTEIVELLERINRSGTTIILATHNKDVVDRLRRRVIAVEHGRVVSDRQIGRYELPSHHAAVGAEGLGS